MAPPSGSGGRARRHKISLACEPCRVRKSRCDGGKPICSTCGRRGLSLDRCVYKLEQNARTASNDEYIAVLHERIRHLERLAQDNATEGPQRVSESPITPSLANINPEEGSPASLAVPGAAGGAPTRLSCPPQTNTSAGHHQQVDGRRVLHDHEPESVDPGITAMGTVASEESLDERDPVGPRDEYHGHSSAASFIKEACDSVMSVAEAPNHTQTYKHPRPSISAPESAVTTLQRLNSASLALPPRSLADHLIERYFNRVFYLYPVFHRPSFERAYNSLWETAANRAQGAPKESPAVGLGGSQNAGPDSIVFYCALNAIFALGCHFSDLTGRDRDATALTFFLRCKAFIGLDFLESDTLSVVQALLIVTLFLQSTPFAGRCWNSVGIACRLAQGLGLHTESSGAGRTAPETEIRRRVWHGCVVLDMLVSMTFGRPTMTTHLQNVPLPSFLEEVDRTAEAPGIETPTRMSYFVQSVRLSAVLETVLDKVYQPWRDKPGRNDSASQRHRFSNFDIVTELDSQLADFEASVPSFLSWTTPQIRDVSADDADLGQLIVMQRNVLRGRFFYVRLMLYRPLLSSLWSSHRHKLSQPSASASVSEPPLSIHALRSSLTVQCGSYCVRCAVHLLDLSYDSFGTEHGTAWWWDALYTSTAGVVLVMALSCPSLQSSLDVGSLEASWEKCQELLSKISTISATVKKSLELLNRFYALTCHKPNTDGNLADPTIGAEEGASLTDMMANFYPEDMMSDLGGFGLDANILGNAW